jgi:tRNA A58 N-methylase Trm61
MSADLKKKTTLLFRENNESHDFANAILEEKAKYDIVIVDGRDRVRCALNAAERLKAGGVIIWDNSERPRYAKGVKQLGKLGFKQLDFFGPVPIDNKLEITSIFYKDKNIFGI